MPQSKPSVLEDSENKDTTAMLAPHKITVNEILLLNLHQYGRQLREIQKWTDKTPAIPSIYYMEYFLG